jgi:ABC-type transporter Mla maintaining outer membrane lipid asymmetry ATPase subunit MlaF
VPDPLVLTDVEKQYGGLRPLRVRSLRVPAGGITMLIGFDRPAAEVFVNLITGASLPDKGEVSSLGRPTRAIADSTEWLAFVERFGIVSDRIVLLEAMTVAQNLALSFDLNLDPVPPAIMTSVTALAAAVRIDAVSLQSRVVDAAPLLRSQIYLARALAFDPAILVLEHPTANLQPGDATTFAGIVREVSARRNLTTIGLLRDEEFAKATGGRLLMWQPATGEVRSPSRLARWRGRTYFSTLTVMV